MNNDKNNLEILTCKVGNQFWTFNAAAQSKPLVQVLEEKNVATQKELFVQVPKEKHVA